MAVKKEISFLPDSENLNSFSARLLNWLTTIGRFIIVFTELIVISAFISRFWLDRKNSDLSEIIRQRKAIIESTQDFQSEYTLLQQRLKYIEQFYNNQPDFPAKITSLVVSTPPDITFSKLTVSQNPKNQNLTASFLLSSTKESSIVDFISNLSVNPDIKSVNVESIEKKQKESTYTVSISLIFNNEN
jgi:Tfp pilus assembly protein PilN